MTNTYEQGFESGKHFVEDLDKNKILTLDNLRKMLNGLKSNERHIKDYWAGYSDGLLSVLKGEW